MKLRFILPALLLLVSFTACKVDNASNSTPTLMLYSPKINGDSVIKMKYTDETLTMVKLDSLHVNDSVVMMIIADAHANNLTELTITPNDTSSVKIIIPDSINKYVSAGSDVKAGKFMFDNTVSFYYPLTFIPKKPNETFKFSFSVKSDAKDVPNQSMFGITFPIKPMRT
ncbi:MAG: hypothetical protein H6Q18_493, partial [Bacteroidetes bacterium]|nr:hypothetical protein [Bacteroidota bacterium]